MFAVILKKHFRFYYCVLQNHITFQGDWSVMQKKKKKKDRNLYFYDFVNFITKVSLREKCPNKEVFLVRIFLCSYWIRRFTEKKLRIWTLFQAVCVMVIIFLLKLEKTIPFLLSFFIITDFTSQVHWRRFE